MDGGRDENNNYSFDSHAKHKLYVILLYNDTPLKHKI